MEKPNVVMACLGVSDTNFKGFMADNAQTNSNAVRIIYGSQDATKPMQNRERTCLFHWKQSMEKHMKADIRQDVQEHHCQLCNKYKNANSMVEDET